MFLLVAAEPISLIDEPIVGIYEPIILGCEPIMVVLGLVSG